MTDQTRRTSEIIEDIIALEPSSETVTIQEFVSRLSDRAFGIVIVIFSLITAFIPGASLVFSIPVFTLAIQMLLGQHQIWIPRRIANVGFSENIVDKALKKILPTMRFLEKFIRPRFTAITSNRGEKFIAVLIILLNLLVVPPLPGLNMIPSLCICFMALALLENDGALAFISIIVSMLVLAFYYGAIYFLIVAVINGAELSMDNLHHMFGKAVEEMNSTVPDVPGVDIDYRHDFSPEDK